MTRWLDNFPWQPVPVHTLPLNQDRWGNDTDNLKIGTDMDDFHGYSGGNNPWGFIDILSVSNLFHPQCSGREG